MPELEKNKKKPNPGQIKEIFTWNEKRTELIVKDTIDLDEEMRERARGVGIYDMLERYGDLELIPGYGADVVKGDGNIHHSADVDFTDIPEFGTDILNAQLAQAEAQLEAQNQKAAEAAKAAEEAKKAAEDAQKKRDAYINQLMAEKGKEGNE